MMNEKICMRVVGNQFGNGEEVSENGNCKVSKKERSDDHVRTAVSAASERAKRGVEKRLGRKRF